MTYDPTMTKVPDWAAGLTQQEVEALSADDIAMLQEAFALDDPSERDGEFSGLPYSPVYDPDGKIIAD